MKDREVLKAAIERYGDESQVRMCFEEMAELQKELCKFARYGNNVKAIAEEIADVQIMLVQMTMIFDCADLVDEQRHSKIRRLAQRLGLEDTDG